MGQTNEKAIGGRTSGRITELIWPLHFTDEMIKRPFKCLRHQHIFEEIPQGTIMTDLFDFQSPLGILGKLTDKIILEGYMRKLLVKRNETIRIAAESLAFR